MLQSSLHHRLIIAPSTHGHIEIKAMLRQAFKKHFFDGIAQPSATPILTAIRGNAQLHHKAEQACLNQASGQILLLGFESTVPVQCSPRLPPNSTKIDLTLANHSLFWRMQKLPYPSQSLNTIVLRGDEVCHLARADLHWLRLELVRCLKSGGRCIIYRTGWASLAHDQLIWQFRQPPLALIQQLHICFGLAGMICLQKLEAILAS